MPDEAPPFDQARAAALIGKYVLVGLTRADHEGRVIELQQMHGRIVSADEKRGFEVALAGQHDGKIYWLPPDTSAFRDAARGEYRLRSTGEVIIDPDVLTSWTVEAPAPGTRKPHLPDSGFHA